MAYIGLDIGTSGCKASIIHENGDTIASGHAEYHLLFPQKGYVELDSAEIFEQVKSVLKELSPKAKEVKALSVSSFGEAFVFLDEQDRPLNRFITYADSRCQGIDEKLLEDYDAWEFFHMTGVVPNISFSLCRIIWMREHCPELINRAEKLFLANDYFNYLLTGNRGVDGGTASKTMMLDVKKLDWSDRLLEKYAIKRKWLSPVLPVGTYLGNLKKEIVEELGLPEGIKVYLGCHDQCSAALGGGAFLSGEAVIGEGSTESINVVTDSSVFSYADQLIHRKMCIEPFLEKGKYIVPVSFLTYGNAVKWYTKTLEKDRMEKLLKGESIFPYLEKESGKRTDLIFLPNLSRVNIMDPQSKVPGAFVGITLNTARWEFYRAMIQGLNFESKMNMDTLCDAGVPIRHISATGGMTKSELFMQLKADVLEQEIYILKNAEAGIAGLAIICAVACGDKNSYQEAMKSFISYKKVYRPKESYQELLEAYQEVRRKLR